MKKMLLFLFVFLFFISCSEGGGGKGLEGLEREESIASGFPITILPAEGLAGSKVMVRSDVFTAVDIDKLSSKILFDDVELDVSLLGEIELASSMKAAGISIEDIEKAILSLAQVVTFIVPEDASIGIHKVVLKYASMESSAVGFKVLEPEKELTPDGSVDGKVDVEPGDYTFIGKEDEIITFLAPEDDDTSSVTVSSMDGDKEYGLSDSGQADKDFLGRDLDSVAKSKKIIDIEANASITCALVENGKMYCAGKNYVGELGVNSKELKESIPKEVNLKYLIYNGDNVSLGISNSCAILRDGSVWCWGGNKNQLIMYSEDINSDSPNIAGGLASPVSLLELGISVPTSYYDEISGKAESNINNLNPEEIEFTEEIAIGENYLCAIRYDGWKKENFILCKGANEYGQLGNGNKKTALKFQKVKDLKNVSKIEAGYFHACAIKKEDGTVWCWGSNSHAYMLEEQDEGCCGNLGNDSMKDSNVPVKVYGLRDVRDISVGAGHTCAIKDGFVWCWGDNRYGQLGNGTRVNSKVPVKVNMLTGIKSVCSGVRHSCVLNEDGDMFCWGANALGQIGNGKTENSVYFPLKVENLSNISKIACGSEHTCALLKSGMAYCWGAGALGQMANGKYDIKNIDFVRSFGEVQ